jgi:hypothetical protein
VGRLVRAGIALLIGAALVGVVGLIAKASGSDIRLVQGCVAIIVAGAGAAVVMSQALYVGTEAARDATAAPPAPGEADGIGGDPAGERVHFTYPAVETLAPQRGRHLRSRRYSLYPLIACLPAAVVLLLALW